MNIFRREQPPFISDAAQYAGNYRGITDGLKCWEIRDPRQEPFQTILSTACHSVSKCSAIPRSAIIIIDIFLRGRVPDSCVFYLMLSGASPRHRRAVVKHLRRSSLPRQFPGLKIDQWDWPPHAPNLTMTRGEGHQTYSSDQDVLFRCDRFEIRQLRVVSQEPTDRLNALLLSIIAHKDDEPVSQSGVVSGTVMIGQEVTFLVPAHIFMSRPPDPEDDEMETDPDSTSESGSSSGPLRAGSATPSDLLTDSEVTQDGMTGDSPADTLPKAGNKARSPSPSFSVPGPIEHFDIFCPELDYGLLQNPLPQTHQLRPISTEAVEHINMGQFAVAATTPSCGTIFGCLDGRPTLMRLPYTTEFTELYPVTFPCPISKGDCGSLVIDRVSGGIYGVIVAASAEGRIAYIISAHEILKDIAARTSRGLGQKQSAKIPQLSLAEETRPDFHGGNTAVPPPPSQHQAELAPLPTPFASSILLRRLPLDTSEEAIRLMTLWCEEPADIELMPVEESQDRGFRSAILRFTTSTAAFEAENLFDGKPNLSKDANMIVEVLTPSAGVEATWSSEAYDPGTHWQKSSLHSQPSPSIASSSERTWPSVVTPRDIGSINERFTAIHERFTAIHDADESEFISPYAQSLSLGFRSGSEFLPDVDPLPDSAATPGPGATKSLAIKSAPLEVIEVHSVESSGDVSRKRGHPGDAFQGSLASRTLKKVFIEKLEKPSGVSHGNLMLTFGNPSHSRSAFTPKRVAETKLARREGVCARCQISKRKCDLARVTSFYEPCSRCASSRLYRGASWMPCFRSLLMDIQLFRSGLKPQDRAWTIRRFHTAVVDNSKPNAPVRFLNLTQCLGEKHLTVYTSEFIPLSSKELSYIWRDAKSNKDCELRLPPFCLTNLAKVTMSTQHYIHATESDYLLLLTEGEELTRMTLTKAYELATKRPESITKKALCLITASRILETIWSIREEADTLGIPPCNDSASPYFGTIPIPPAMAVQLDHIVIDRFLNPRRKSLLEQFEAMIHPLVPANWWELYLTSFTLLRHIEKLAEHSVFLARRDGLATKYCNTPFLESVFHSAKVILSRFHFVCKGAAVLRVDWDSPTTARLAQLDPDQVEFMKVTQSLIKAKEAEIVQLRSTYRYDAPLYWTSQLFTEDWDNSPVSVREVEVGHTAQDTEFGPEQKHLRASDTTAELGIKATDIL